MLAGTLAFVLACDSAGPVAEDVGTGAIRASTSEAIAQAPTRFPAGAPQREAYVGASTCAECHAEVAAIWRESRHGKAMAEVSDETVLGRFDGTPVSHPAGQIVPQRVGGAYFMKYSGIKSENPLHRPALVLGAGRQHQVYLEKVRDESAHVLMPIYWASVSGSWVSTPRSRGFSSLHEWRQADLFQLNCQKCHLSQAFYDVGESGPEFSWVDLPVNCESCHGPGRDHVEARRAGTDGAHFRDLRDLSKEEEVELCGQCHGSRASFEFDQNGYRTSHWTTLDDPVFRSDGTQFASAYQLGGHVLSDCYQEGAMRCVSCHDPHTTLARDLAGNSAEGEHSDRQCTVCHRNYIEPATAVAHSRHGGEVRCVDCHMSMSWIGDSPAIAHQRSSDHSISIPRPAEAAAFGLPNACTTCHTDRSAAWALEAVEGFGAASATGVRDWVRAVHLGREQREEAVEPLLALVAAPETGRFLRISALNLLASYPVSASIAREIRGLSEHEDAQVRSAAFSALRKHAEDSAQRWLERQASDPEASVRLGALDAVDRLPAAPRLRLLRDLLEHADLPPFDLGKFIEPLAREGDLAQAAALVELGLRHTANVNLPRWQKQSWVQRYPPLARTLRAGLCRRGDKHSCVDPAP